VRSHPQAATVGPIKHRARSLGIFASAFAACVVVIGLLAGPALASIPFHPFLETFGSAAQPTFPSPVSIAIDQGSGDAYVADSGAKTVSRFHEDGTPAPFADLGTNVIDGQGSGSGPGSGGSCVPVSLECDETPLNSVLGTYGGPGEVQVAIDESGGATDGNVYVTDVSHSLINAFSSAGEYLGRLTQYKEGADASGSLASFGESCGVAVDGSGAVYTGDFNGYVHKFVPSGSFPVNADNTANFSNTNTCQVAAGAGPTAGYVFASSLNSSVAKIDSTTGATQYNVPSGFGVKSVSVDPSSGHVYTVATNANSGFAEFDASGASSAILVSQTSYHEGQGGAALAVNGGSGKIYVSSGFGNSKLGIYGSSLQYNEIPVTTKSATDILATRAVAHGTVDPGDETVIECKFEYGTVASGTFSQSAPCDGSIPPGASLTYVAATLEGLLGATEYQFRLSVTTPHVVSTSEASTFTTLRRLRTVPASDIGASSATLNGAVRPEGQTLTTCRFEYGATNAYGSIVPCAQTVEPDSSSHLLSAAISGLGEGVVYHFRLVVADVNGTYAGQDEAFTTEGQNGLPDNRAYEQVSPVDKNESDINFSADFASTNGNKLAFLARGAFAGAPTAQGAEGNPYLATRGPNGWTTESTSLPDGELNNTNGYLGYMPDLSKGVISWREESPAVETYDPSAAHGQNLYMRDNTTGTLTLVNGSEPVGATPKAFVWGSSDFSHLALDTSKRLTEDSPCTGLFGEEEHCAYEWVNGTIRVASVLPNGQKVPGAVGGAASGTGTGVGCNFEHAMSDDGSRLFFTYMFFGVIPKDIYARDNGTSTTLVTGAERTLPGGASGYEFHYQSAEAAHGNKVLFSTKNSLVDADDDETGDLYLYDFNKPEGERLTLVSEDQNPVAPQGAAVLEVGSSPCLSVVGTSEDLHRVYYVAQNQIVAGDPEDVGPKLFLWDDTSGTPQTTYIGTLSGERDYWAWRASVYNGETVMRNARWSANGHYLAFVSSAQLTDFENEEHDEMYRYDAVGHELDCISCTADSITAGSPVESEVGFNKIFYTKLPMNHQLRNVSEDGKVFFQTFRSLVPRDSNGKSDVYEYENGHLHLISSGTGTDDSFFLDANPSGSDVFFLTRDKLVGWDVDNNRDVYDARVGGGFPEPPPKPPACEGDACQPPPTVPNDPTPSSAGFNGAGNPSTQKHSRRCAKGKVRMKGKCLKRTRKAKRHHNRHTTRANG
jgi:hypothetical protein